MLPPRSHSSPGSFTPASVPSSRTILPSMPGSRRPAEPSTAGIRPSKRAGEGWRVALIVCERLGIRGQKLDTSRLLTTSDIPNPSCTVSVRLSGDRGDPSLPSEKVNSGPALIVFLKCSARIGGKCAAPDIMEITVAKSCGRSFLW